MKTRHKKEGAILLVSSVAALLDGPFAALYCASKAYVLSYAKCLYHELKPDGIDVMSYNPGYVDTPLIKDVPKEKRAGCITAEHAVDVSLRDLGVESYSLGA